MTQALAALCRLCGAPLRLTFADLGSSPLANSFVEPEELDRPDPTYPLLALVCGTCFLVQLPAVVSAESIFGEYAYFSSYSESWLEHARRYVESIVERLGLATGSFVVEVASNDGYLLQYFLPLGVGVLGVEPARNVAAVARERGIPTVEEFLGRDVGERLAREHGHADLVVANNVLAHVPDLHDFTAGLRELVADDGVLTLEFPHLLRLMERHDLPRGETYTTFDVAAREIRRELVAFLEEARSDGRSVAAYGAAAKGNTLLNYCGIDSSLVEYVADRSPHKQGRFLPGSRPRVYAPEHVRATKPDYLLLLAWNLRDEIVEQMSFIREWGGRFVVPIPRVTVIG